MKKYKLIKEYPGSDHEGIIVSLKTPNGLYEGYQYNYSTKHVENNPEYWEEVVEKDYEIMISRVVPYTILSVKRLSDGEVFTVGDLIKTPYTECTRIVGFKNPQENEYFIGIPTGFTRLLSLEKVKNPIFLTHDGKDIFEGDKVWYVNKDNLYYDYAIALTQTSFNSNIHAYFISAVDAQDYIKKNKVLFTTEDGKDIFEGDTVWWVRKDSTSIIGRLIVPPGEKFNSDMTAYFLTEEEAKDYLERNKVLFTTADGVKIRKGDMIHGVYRTTYAISNTLVACNRGLHDTFEAIFSTRAAAENYLVQKSHSLSIEDFWEFVSWGGSNIAKSKRLKRLVKERLNLK